MANKYLDSNGLLYLWGKIKAKFATKDELSKKVNGLESGTTTGHVVTWGANGYTVADSGFTIGCSVPANAKFTDTTYVVATTTTDGLMSSTNVIKLNGIEANANNYVLPMASATVLGGVKVGEGLSIDADGILSANITEINWSSIIGKPSWIGDTKPTYTKAEVGLGNVTNDAQVKRSEMGVANGVATLDATGLVPSNQLPSFVDDVVEGYYNNNKFYKEASHTTEIVGEQGKIYIDLSTSPSKSYRWSGATYTIIDSSDMVAITNAEIDVIVAS